MKYLYLFLLLSFPLVLKAQSEFNFDFDYARFGYDSVSNYVEFYYSFRQNELSTVQKDSGLYQKAVLHIELQDSISGNFLLNKDWRIDNPVTDTSILSKEKSLVGVVGFVIPSGVYYCTVSGTDALDSTKTASFSEIIRVEPLISENLGLSDIQLATQIRQEGANSNSIFYKNTLEVYPNPAMIFGHGMPVLYYYSELYGLQNDTTGENLKISTILFNSRGTKIYEKTKYISKSSSSRVEVGTVNVNKYPTDTYSILISAIDSAINYGVTTAKRFYIYNPSVIDSIADNKTGNKRMLSSQYSVLSAEECDDLFEKSKYVASPGEIDQYSQLESVESKREFLFNFWQRRDMDPSTEVNEFYNEYMNRIRISQEKYGTLNRNGMKTDRGRIFILYGEPDEVDRYPSDIDKKPYEVWQYNQIEGGVIFIFGDVTGFSNYELLHSTKRGELRDDNWLRRIQTN